MDLHPFILFEFLIWKCHSSWNSSIELWKINIIFFYICSVIDDYWFELISDHAHSDQ